MNTGRVKITLATGKTFRGEYGKPLCRTLRFGQVSELREHANDIEPGEYVPIWPDGGLCHSEEEDDAIAFVRVERVEVRQETEDPVLTVTLDPREER